MCSVTRCNLCRSFTPTTVLQEINLSGWPETQSSTQEVQTISIDTADVTSRFRVGLSGVYTSQLTRVTYVLVVI